MPPGPAEPAAARKFGGDHLDPHRVLADAQRAKLLDRAFEGAGQRAAEIGRPNPDRPIVRLDFEGDDRTLAVRVFRGAGERLVGRERHDIGVDASNFHRIKPFAQRPARDKTSRPNKPSSPPCAFSPRPRWDVQGAIVTNRENYLGKSAIGLPPFAGTTRFRRWADFARNDDGRLIYSAASLILTGSGSAPAQPCSAMSNRMPSGPKNFFSK